MNKQMILQKITTLKLQIDELERIIRGDDVHRIEAGYSHDSMLVNYVDRNGIRIPAAPTIKNNPEADKLNLMLRGIHRAIGMIPVSELPRYLEDNGPQIELYLYNINIFEDSFIVDEQDRLMLSAMKGHFKNYRIKIIKITENDYNKLLETSI